MCDYYYYYYSYYHCYYRGGESLIKYLERLDVALDLLDYGGGKAGGGERNQE